MSDTVNSVPWVTVVTVVYNGAEFIESTILSVLGQTCKNIEYVIIDGGSSDKTVEIIKKYESKIHYWISEDDAGIYDAMNKGINIAKGSWINFMNAGDTFSSESVVEDIFSLDHSGSTILYGDTEVIYPSFSRLAKARDIKNISKGMPFSHQSSFVKTDYHRQHKFNIKNRIVADMEFFMSAHCSDIVFKYLSVTISKVTSGGVSDINRLTTIIAWWRTSVTLGSSNLIALHFGFIMIDCFARDMLKKLLPRCVVYMLQKNR